MLASKTAFTPGGLYNLLGLLLSSLSLLEALRDGPKLGTFTFVLSITSLKKLPVNPTAVAFTTSVVFADTSGILPSTLKSLLSSKEYLDTIDS